MVEFVGLFQIKVDKTLKTTRCLFVVQIYIHINRKYNETIFEEHFKRCMCQAMSRISGIKCPRVMEENAPSMRNIYP